MWADLEGIRHGAHGIQKVAKEMHGLCPMSGHSLMLMSIAGVIGSLRLTGVRHKCLNPMMHRWTMNRSVRGTHAKPNRSCK